MAYVINQALCSCCHQCKAVCPADAVRFKGVKYWIDPEKCIECGLCAQNCHNCIITKEGQAPETVPAHEPTVLDADVVIAGGGGSGLVAAVRLAQAGKKVVLLEKSKKVRLVVTLEENTTLGGLGLPGAMIEQALAEAGIEGSRRPETLSCDEFAALSSALARKAGKK